MSREQHPLRDHLRIFGPAVAITLLGFVLTLQFVEPAPPDRIRIASGGEGGAYHLFAGQYRTFLARERIELQVLPSRGSIDNIERLERGEVEVAFVQGGTARPPLDPELISLGSLYFEPLWVFYREGQPLARLSDLAGRRIAVGPEGSGTRSLANRHGERSEGG